MTSEEQRLAIGTVSKWRPLEIGKDHPDEDIWYTPNGGRRLPKRFGGGLTGEMRKGLPDYTRDLNAIHNALVTLTESEQRTCFAWLGELVSRREKRFVDDSVAGVRATAADWCEAYLRTKRIWKESPAS